MTLEEFKLAIENNTLQQKYIVAVCEDESSNFIFHQYLRHYSECNSLSVEFIDDLYSVSRTNLFTTNTPIIKVYYTTKLDMKVIPTQEIVWVRCKSIDKNILSELSPYIIEIPKLEFWHIKDYVYSLCEGIPHNELDLLLNYHKNNIYGLSLEIEKLLLFPDIVKAYSTIKSQLFNDVSEYGIFDLVNCIIRCDTLSLTNILQQIDNIDVDVFGLIKLLMTNFKKIIDIQLSKHPTAENLHMSSKQFWAIKKYSCGIYTKHQLVEIYKLLTKCDFYIKSGYISSTNMIDYIIINIMSIKERII